MTSQTSGDAAHRLAANVRKARGEAGLSQRGLAERINTDSSLVSKWERGQHSPSAVNLAAVATVTGRDLAWFYTDHSQAKAVEKTA